MGLFTRKTKFEKVIEEIADKNIVVPEEPEDNIEPVDWLGRTEEQRLAEDIAATEAFKTKHKK